MSLKEDYEKWADGYPSGVAYTLKHNQSYFEVWQAGIKYITSRPTSDGRFDKEAFRTDDPETIVDRLNGLYNVPGVPGQYKPSPINLEAAREIERLREALLPFAAYASHYPKERKYGNRVTVGEWHSVESGGIGRAQIDVEDFHRAAALTRHE